MNITIMCVVCCALMLVWVGYLLLKIRSMEQRFGSSRGYLESRINDLEKTTKSRTDQIEHYFDSRYDLIKEDQEFMYNKIEDLEGIADDLSQSFNRQAVDVADIRISIEQNKSYMNKNIDSIWKNSQALESRFNSSLCLLNQTRDEMKEYYDILSAGLDGVRNGQTDDPKMEAKQAAFEQRILSSIGRTH